jgi:hypothetical protein
VREGKNLERAVVLSWVLPGAGQMYLCAFRSGLVFAVPYIALAVLNWTGVLPYLVVVGPALIIWWLAMRGVLIIGGKEPSLTNGWRWIRENAR